MNVEIKNCPIEIANDIWNAAIEQAAIEALNEISDSELAIMISKIIRRLKK